MAKYDVKYPDAGTEVTDWADGPAGIFKTKDAGCCMVCKESTHFIDMLLHGRICSEECDKAWLEHYNETIRFQMECEERHEAARVAGTDHEFQPDDESSITASCDWCGKQVDTRDPDYRAQMEGKCSARVGTDFE